MIGFIKDRNTFQTLDMMLDISQYDLILGSTNNNVGTVQVPVEVEGLENQFFIADDRIWIVKSLAPDNGRTIIMLNDVSWMFARDLLWDDNTTYTTIEECIADTIDTEYINLTDAMYDTPYVRVSYSTATAWIKPDTENGLWNLKGYIAKVRRMKNVFLSFSISGNYLDIEIEQKTPTLWKMDFATDVAKMYQETYQKTSTAKITVNGTTDYYLYSDGTYGTNGSPSLPLTRVEGDWVQLQVTANENEADKVEDTFSKNAESMILEFYTTEPVEFYDTVQLRHEGRVVTGTLSLVSISSSDNRRYCKTGDLINTVPEAISVLSERIEKVTKTVERSTSDNIQGDLHVSGDIYEGGVKLEDKYLPTPTQYVYSRSWTDWQNAKTRTYTVSGDGFVFVSVSAKDSGDNDTGSVWIDVLQNNNQIGYSYVRLQTAGTPPIGANVAVMTAVANGDVIVARVNASKLGTATAWWRTMAFGCTLTES